VYEWHEEEELVQEVGQGVHDALRDHEVPSLLELARQAKLAGRVVGVVGVLGAYLLQLLDLRLKTAALGSLLEEVFFESGRAKTFVFEFGYELILREYIKRRHFKAFV